MIDRTLPLEEKECKRNANLIFMVIPCKNTFINILGRLFLVSLNVMDSLVHLKVAYYTCKGKPGVINANLNEVRRIREVTFKNLIISSVVEEVALRRANMLDFETRKDEVRPIADGDLEVI